MSSEWIFAAEAVCIAALFASVVTLMVYGGCRNRLDALCCWAAIMAAVSMLLLGLVGAFWFGV